MNQGIGSTEIPKGLPCPLCLPEWVPLARQCSARLPVLFLSDLVVIISSTLPDLSLFHEFSMRFFSLTHVGKIAESG